MSEAVTDSSYLRQRVYWWLERPDRAATGPWMLEIALIALITLNVAAVTREPHQERANHTNGQADVQHLT